MKRRISLLIALVMVLSFSIIGFGDMVFEKIEADLVHDMKFQVDGEMWQPKDVDGTLLSPLIYKGRSYVPVRALLEEKDVKVDYDAKRRTILLDYPAKDIDKSSPLLFQRSEIGGPYKEWPNYDILFNKAFESEGLGFTNSIEMELADDTMLMLNGKEVSMDELMRIGSITGGGAAGKATFRLKGDADGKIGLAIDSKTKLVKGLVMDGDPVGESDPVASKISVEVTFSGPKPWKITIVIKF